MDARSLSAFLIENAEQTPNKEVVISRRFKDTDGNPIKWELKPIPTAKMRKIRKDSMRFVGNKLDIDIDVLNMNMAVESVVFPNLKDAELQKNYGVMGEAALLEALLTLPGEYDELVSQVTDLCGYNAEELVEEAKN